VSEFSHHVKGLTWQFHSCRDREPLRNALIEHNSMIDHVCKALHRDAHLWFCRRSIRRITGKNENVCIIFFIV